VTYFKVISGVVRNDANLINTRNSNAERLSHIGVLMGKTIDPVTELHAGDIGGFNTDMRRMVDEHATIIFLSNTRDAGRGYRDIVPFTVTRILFGPVPTLPPARAHVPESALERWNGPVPVAPGVTVDARARGGQVWLTASTQEGMFALAGADSTARVQALRRLVLVV